MRFDDSEPVKMCDADSFTYPAGRCSANLWQRQRRLGTIILAAHYPIWFIIIHQYSSYELWTMKRSTSRNSSVLYLVSHARSFGSSLETLSTDLAVGRWSDARQLAVCCCPIATCFWRLQVYPGGGPFGSWWILHMATFKCFRQTHAFAGVFEGCSTQLGSYVRIKHSANDTCRPATASLVTVYRDFCRRHSSSTMCALHGVQLAGSLPCRVRLLEPIQSVWDLSRHSGWCWEP